MMQLLGAEVLLLSAGDIEGPALHAKMTNQ